MAEGWRRAHKDVAMAIGLDAIRKLGENWIRQDFGPTLEIELRLRNALRELNGDRHRQKYARNEKKEATRYATWQRNLELSDLGRFSANCFGARPCGCRAMP